MGQTRFGVDGHGSVNVVVVVVVVVGGGSGGRRASHIPKEGLTRARGGEVQNATQPAQRSPNGRLESWGALK